MTIFLHVGSSTSKVLLILGSPRSIESNLQFWQFLQKHATFRKNTANCLKTSNEHKNRIVNSIPRPDPSFSTFLGSGKLILGSRRSKNENFEISNSIWGVGILKMGIKFTQNILKQAQTPVFPHFRGRGIRFWGPNYRKMIFLKIRMKKSKFLGSEILKKDAFGNQSCVSIAALRFPCAATRADVESRIFT